MSSTGNLLGLQLNCRSIRNKLGELKILVYTRKPDFMAFCETWLNRHAPKFVGYSGEWQHRPHGTGGGLGLIIKRGIQYNKIELNPFSGGVLEVQAVKIFLGNGSDISILNAYNPNKNVGLDEFNHYIGQLGGKYVLIGDFNAHSPTIDDRVTRANNTGQSIEQLFLNHGVLLANPRNLFTYYNIANTTRSCLDLCLSSSNLGGNVEVRTLRDIGSDHLPLEIDIQVEPIRNEVKYRKKWKIDDNNIAVFKCTDMTRETFLPDSTVNLVRDFTDRVFKNAESIFGRTSGKPRQAKMACWWDIDCNKALAQRRKARKLLDSNPSDYNVQLYKEKRDEYVKLCDEKKESSFQNFVSKIDIHTPTKVVWNKIKAIKGFKPIDSPPLIVGNQVITNPQEKARSFAEFYQQNSTTYTHKSIEGHENEIASAIDGGEGEDYNSPITIEELDKALTRTKNTSPGEDEIPYLILKNLHPNMKRELLNIYNQCFFTGEFPRAWKEGLIVPIGKPLKPKTQVESYRPITLLSCMGKLYERIIQRRLEFIAEKDNYLSQTQCGFRKGLSTIDILLRLEHNIRKCLSNRLIYLVLYVDLKSAFDTVWGDGVILKLIEKGLKGRLIATLRNFFKDRWIKVLVEGEKSEAKEMSAGTPQGSVLSPLLFNIMLNDIPRFEGIDQYIYADDITLAASGSTMRECKRGLQHYIKEFTKWCREWGLKVNPQKCVIQYFTKKRTAYPIIRIENRVVEYKRSHKLLGLVLDCPQLNFREHIKKLRIDCIERLNLMKVIASNKWGAQYQILRSFYIAYIRSKINYASLIYASAKDYLLRKLEVIQNSALRLMLGAQRSSPILSLQAETAIPPLTLYGGYNNLKQYIRLKCKPSAVNTMNILEIDKTSTPVLNTFRYRYHKWREKLQVGMIRRSDLCSHDIPPWQTVRSFIVEGAEIRDNNNFQWYMNENFREYLHIYTDGSKMTIDNEISTACAIYNRAQNQITCWKLRKDHSVIASELFAILKALQFINDTDKWGKYIILTDSYSSLQIIENPGKNYSAVVGQISHYLGELNRTGAVLLHWVKSHINIPGNEIADKAAKLAHSNDRTELYGLEDTEYISILKTLFYKYFDNYWKETTTDTGKGLFLRNVRSEINYKCLTKHISHRKSQVVFHRLRIGHLNLQTHLYRIQRAEDNLCQNQICNENQIPETVDHYLLECPAYASLRNDWRENLRRIGIVNFDLKTVLAASGEHPRYFDIVKYLLTYVRGTARLDKL